MRPIKESVLLKTSAATDVQCSGGNVAITGLKPVSKKDITAIKQVKYRAEVAQVVTVGGTAYTPASNTTYTVVVTDPLRVYAGYSEPQKRYSYTTGTVTGVAATDRETIHVALVAKINADASCHATAATSGGGTGFTVTDDGSYYPVWAQNMTNVKGINSVYTVTNPDGSGFTSTNFSVTTAGVYSYGVGANLLAEKPVVDYVYGNLISGVLYAPPLATDGTGATSGQNYDGFIIESMKAVDAIGVTGQFAYAERTQYVFVDNGTGSSTTNLTGFGTFERAMHRLIYSQFANDPSTTATLFDTPPVFASVTVSGTGLPAVNGVPTGATGDINTAQNQDAVLNYAILGAGQTKIVPTYGASGLTLDLDAADDEGAEYSAPLQTNSSKQFVVGKQEFSLYAKFSIADVSDTDDCAFGFRKKEAYQANLDDYDEMACLNVIAGDIKIETILNAGATTTTDTTQNWADGETHSLEVYVDINGAVTYKIDGAKPTTTAAFSFDAGEVVVPFAYVLNAAASAPGVVTSEFAAIPSNTWRS